MPTWMAIPPHETRHIAKGWDGPDFGNTAPTFEGLRAVHAAWDPTGDPLDVKSYAFPHHERAGGPANTLACLLHVGYLIGEKGQELGADVRKAVHAHLAGHLDDAGVPIPELDAGDAGLKQYAALVRLLAETDAMVGGMRAVMGQRSGKGKKALTGAVHNVTELLYAKMAELRDIIDVPQEVAAREYLRYVQNLRGDEIK